MIGWGARPVYMIGLANIPIAFPEIKRSLKKELMKEFPMKKSLIGIQI